MDFLETNFLYFQSQLGYYLGRLAAHETYITTHACDPEASLECRTHVRRADIDRTDMAWYERRVRECKRAIKEREYERALEAGPWC